MDLLIALIISLAFAIILKPAIKRFAWVFYLLAAVVAALFASHVLMDVAPVLARALYPYLQRCLFAFGLFAIVMYIGVFPENSRFRKHLNPIRGELSIIASILTLGHVVNYGRSYLMQLVNFSSLGAWRIASFVISFILVVLLAVLAVTSFNFVRKRMKVTSWKRVQWFAYPFFALIFVHVIFMLGSSISSVGGKAFLSFVMYTFIIGVYLMLRVWRAYVDGKAKTPQKLQ